MACSLVLFVFLGGVQLAVLPPNSYFPPPVPDGVCVDMMLLTARMRWFRWDVTHAFAFRLAITVFTIVLLCTVAQVNSSSLSGGRKFLLSRGGQHDAYFGGCCCERGPSQLSATALLHHPVRRPRHLGRRHFPVIAGRRQRRRIDFGDDRLFAPLPSGPSSTATTLAPEF